MNHGMAPATYQERLGWLRGLGNVVFIGFKGLGLGSRLRGLRSFGLFGFGDIGFKGLWGFRV